MLGQKFATRLNSFASRAEQAWPGQAGKPSALQMAERASRAEGLTDVDLNYPDHMDQGSLSHTSQIDAGISEQLSRLH